MYAGVLPSMASASLPSATTSVRPLSLRKAITDGEFSTTPAPSRKIRVLAVPRSIAIFTRLRNFIAAGLKNADEDHRIFLPGLG